MKSGLLLAELNTAHDLNLKGGPLAAELNTAHDLRTLTDGPLAAELSTLYDLIVGQSSDSGAKYKKNKNRGSGIFSSRV